jgi:Holliday junction resolvase RusA-like endonuclease
MVKERTLEPVIHLVFKGEIGPYQPHKTYMLRNAPKTMAKSQVLSYIRQYAPHTALKRRLQAELQRQLPPDFKPLTGPIGLEIHHWRRIPVSRKKAVEGDFVTTRPDETNLDKLIEDVLTGFVYEDDNQVCARPGFDFKRYAVEPRTEVWVYLMESDE